MFPASVYRKVLLQFDRLVNEVQTQLEFATEVSFDAD